SRPSGQAVVCTTPWRLRWPRVRRAPSDRRLAGKLFAAYLVEFSAAGFSPDRELSVTRYDELNFVDRPGAGEFAGIESEFLDMNHAGVVVAMFLEERVHQRRRDTASACDGEMGCPGAFLDRQIACKSSFVHTL